MSKLVIIRHGQAQGNSERRLIGQSNVPLTTLGKEQARLVTERLGATPIDRIISSDLDRALYTITGLAKRQGHTISTDQRLREIDNGEWSGLLPTEIEERWPDLWADYRSGADVDRPGGESWDQVRQRVRSFLEQVSDLEGTTVIATHGGPVLLMVEWVLGLNLPGNVFTGDVHPMQNASLTTFDLAPPRLLGLNDIGHLQTQTGS